MWFLYFKSADRYILYSKLIILNFKLILYSYWILNLDSILSHFELFNVLYIRKCKTNFFKMFCTVCSIDECSNRGNEQLHKPFFSFYLNMKNFKSRLKNKEKNVWLKRFSTFKFIIIVSLYYIGYMRKQFPKLLYLKKFIKNLDWHLNNLLRRSRTGNITRVQQKTVSTKEKNNKTIQCYGNRSQN